MLFEPNWYTEWQSIGSKNNIRDQCTQTRRHRKEKRRGEYRGWEWKLNGEGAVKRIQLNGRENWKLLATIISFRFIHHFLTFLRTAFLLQSSTIWRMEKKFQLTPRIIRPLHPSIGGGAFEELTFIRVKCWMLLTRNDCHFKGTLEFVSTSHFVFCI